MREIKFRAWGIKDKKMFQDLQVRNRKDKDGFISLNSILRNNVFKVMQFTGLKDKNGKDIYEGDIFKDESKSINEVDFNNGSYWIDQEHLSRWNESGEVIGNIYENPELLK